MLTAHNRFNIIRQFSSIGKRQCHTKHVKHRKNKLTGGEWKTKDNVNN